jgi:hypothetical protein
MIPDLPKHANGQLNEKVLRAQLPSWPEASLVRLLNAIALCRSRRNNSNEFSIELTEDELLDIAILESAYEARKVTISQFQAVNCTGCTKVIPELINTAEVCCSFTYERKIVNGWCQNSPNPNKPKPEDAAVEQVDEEDIEDEDVEVAEED